MPEMETKETYKVVVNHEEQYSIWPEFKQNALGWKDVGHGGTKESCLEYISKHWVDLTPVSVRKSQKLNDTSK
jgi:MbtH protein